MTAEVLQIRLDCPKQTTSRLEYFMHLWSLRDTSNENIWKGLTALGIIKRLDTK